MILQRYFGQGKIEKLNKEFSYYRKKYKLFIGIKIFVAMTSYNWERIEKALF